MFGQTADDIELLKYQDDSKSYDENFENTRLSHSIFAAILSRTLNPSTLTEEILDGHIGKLKEMVGEQYFADYHKVKHGSSCPAETVDLFSLPSAKRYSEVQGGESPFDLSDILGDSESSESGKPGDAQIGESDDSTHEEL